jgi:hypothetical protein
MSNRKIRYLWPQAQLLELDALKIRAAGLGLMVEVHDRGTKRRPLLIICFYREDRPVASFTDLTGASLWLDGDGGRP